MIMTVIATIKNLKVYIFSFLICCFIALSSYQIGSHTGYSNGYDVRDKEAIHQITNMQLEGERKYIALQKDKQNEVNQIKDDYSSKLQNLQKTTDNTIANLNNDNVRLRIQIKRSSSSTDCSRSSTTGQSDDYADLSEGSSRYLISQAIKADEWIKHLQALVLELNKKLQEKSNK